MNIATTPASPKVDCRRSVDVCVAQRDVRQTKGHVVIAKIEFACEFADSVGTQGQGLMLLSGRDRLTVAVNGPARRGKNDSLHARILTSLQQIDETDDIDARIEAGISDGTADIHLRRMVVQNIRLDLCNQLSNFGIGDIDSVNFGAGI